MAYLEELQAGSDAHAVEPGNGLNFKIVPKSEDDGDRRAFQAVAREALSRAGVGYRALEHKAGDWGLKDWTGPVYDLVLIMPPET